MGNKRIIELDILRGIAVLSVVLFHYTSRYNIAFEANTMKLFEFNYGHYGVQLFFIISGFVIFMTLERSKTTLDFIKRRFIRLYPTFWMSMILTFAITYIAQIPRFERTFMDLIANITMVPNLIGYKAIDGVYWSLEVELIFYFLLAVLFQFKLLKFIYAFLCSWLIIGATINYLQIPYLHVFLITGYSYLFIAGISFYKIWKYKEANNWHFNALIFLSLTYAFSKKIEEGIVVLLFFLLFYLFISQKLKSIKNFKFFRAFIFLGDISYPLYLIHQFIGMLLIYYISKYTHNYFVLLLIPLVITTLVAWIITRYLEKPIQQRIKFALFKSQDEISHPSQTW